MRDLGLAVLFSAFMLPAINAHAQSTEHLPAISQAPSGPASTTLRNTQQAASIPSLKFNELFKMPVGPRGLEPSEKLISLQNKEVRIIGYMAKQETPTPGLFILSPLPVNMGDEDDMYADDMPAHSVFVHLHETDAVTGYTSGLINIIGVLDIGNKTETDGRVSYVRIQINQSLSSITAQQQASK